MISLGRQQYDLYAAVVSEAQLAAKPDTEPSRTPSVDRFLGSASASGSAPSES
jgi:heat shock protein HspQ